MKKAVVLVIVFTLSLLVLPAQAHDTGHSCPHGGATITDLQNCVAHAAEMGHIDNPGILNALQAKLSAAQRALSRGHVHVALNNLNAFIHLTEAQAGKHISANHAEHMIHHAQHVVDAITH